MLQLKKYTSIHQIDQLHWDSILDSVDILHSWQFIRIVEDAKVENSRFRYLLLYKEEELIATTVLSAFTISLDIFITDNAWVRLIKKWLPHFFNVKILICGLPASFGQLNLKIVDEIFADEVCKMIAQEMRTLAKEWKIRFLSVKEFLEHNKNLGGRLLKEGFFLANSIPYMSMKINWDSYSAYINSLRHHYRRHILKSLQKIKCERPYIIHSEEYNGNTPGIKWVLSDPDWISPQKYYKLYLKVMERTKTKLETLNLAFFEELFKDNENYQLLSLVDRGNILSSALLVDHGETLIFMLVGRENEKDEYNTYFNLVYGIIAYAIEKKYNKIKLGQTAYWVKQSIGGIAEGQYVYFACTGKLRHWILKSLNTQIFPPTKLYSVKIFKERIFSKRINSYILYH
jgi:predicted N-acyltransferase